MSIAKLNERALLDLGLDRQTVAALRHVIAQTGNQIGARTLPAVATQAAVLDLHASLLANVVAGNTAADVPIVSLPFTGTLKAGMTVSGRIVGQTSNGATPGTLNLWLSVGGVKVFTHAFTTPDVLGTAKGFAADFTLIVRSPGLAMAGGVLSLAYNAPTVLPSVSESSFFVPATGATFALGMNWTAANASNTATAKLATLTVDKL